MATDHFLFLCHGIKVAFSALVLLLAAESQATILALLIFADTKKVHVHSHLHLLRSGVADSATALLRRVFAQSEVRGTAQTACLFSLIFGSGSWIHSQCVMISQYVLL